MTTTVDANNSSGFKVTADTSGILQLQTNGTAALTVDTSQNVGIGTTTPTLYSGYTTLQVNNTSTSKGVVAVGPATTGGYLYSDGGQTSLTSLGATPLTLGTNNTERMRILTTGNILSLSGGSTTATGTGIAFPATQSASSDANTLDDYEEGTWTPSLGGNTTYSQQGGTYKKVGALVYVSAIIQVATLGTGSSSQISGFPFTYSAGPRNTFSLSYWASTVGNISYLAFYLSSGTTANTIATTAAASSVSDGYGVFQNGTYVIFSGCYHAS